MPPKDKEFEAAVAAEVAKQLKKAREVTRELTQDQYDLLCIVAPNRAARGDYKIVEPVEPETIEE